MTAALRLLVLGAGRHQVGLIRKAEEQGVETVVADYYPDSPGKAFASHSTMTDALDIEANIALAKEFDVAGVITSGTDQALVTMADVASALDLPCYLSPESARACTNKSHMSKALDAAGVEQARSRVVTNEQDSVEDLAYPLIVKPTDSQGQRGIRICGSPATLRSALVAALEASRSGTAIVEQFLEGPEITVSAWIHDAERVDALLISDRVTFNRSPAVGVAFQHIQPSEHAAEDHAELTDIARRVAAAFQLQHGPLYIQLILTDSGYRIVEATCRVGGGHEEALIRRLYGFPLNERLIDLALGRRAAPPEDRFLPGRKPGVLWVNFLLAREGLFESMGFPQADEQLLEGGFYHRPGYRQGVIANGQGRIGYFVAQASDHRELRRTARRLYSTIHVRDEHGAELLFWPDSEDMNGGAESDQQPASNS